MYVKFKNEKKKKKEVYKMRKFQSKEKKRWRFN